jgi:hypothetical protein
MEKNNKINTIEKVSSVLAYLLELKKKGQYQSGIELIDDTLSDFFAFNGQETNKVSEEFLKQVCEDSQNITPELINSMGDLLKEKGSFLYAQNRLKESKEILKNALTIYFYLNENQDFFSFERMNKMVMINKKLSQINLKVEY